MSGAVVDYRVFWDEVTVGDVVPPLAIPITLYKAVLIPGVTLDPFPGHYDPAYARANGVETVFMNTMPLLGIFNRHGTDWAGPGAFIARQHIRMVRPVCAGIVAHVTGAVTKVHEAVGGDGRARRLVDIESEIRDETGALLTLGGVSLELPRRAEMSA